jgi:hypothetical protein
VFDLLPENMYSRSAVRWGLVVSALFIGAGVIEMVRHRYDDGLANIVLGLAMLFIWALRRTKPPLVDVSQSKVAP